jgi:hypothetical protein
MRAIFAYEQADGYLIIETEDPNNGNRYVKCLAREPGRAIPPVPANEALMTSSPATGLMAHVKGLLGWFHIRRHRRTLETDLQSSEAGDLNAHHRVLNTMSEYQHLRFGKELKRPQGKPDHLAIMMIGLLYGFDELTGNELANAYDKICSCEAKPHDSDSLERLRRWVRSNV